MGKNSPVNLSSFEPMLSYVQQVADKMNFQDPVGKSMLSVIPET